MEIQLRWFTCRKHCLGIFAEKLLTLADNTSSQFSVISFQMESLTRRRFTAGITCIRDVKRYYTVGQPKMSMAKMEIAVSLDVLAATPVILMTMYWASKGTLKEWPELPTSDLFDWSILSV